MILDMNGNPMVNTPITGGFGMPKNAFAVANGGAKLTDLNNTDMNDVTYFNYLFEMMGIYMSVFEWSNLPEGVDARMLEYWSVILWSSSPPTTVPTASTRRTGIWLIRCSGCLVTSTR